MSNIAVHKISRKAQATSLFLIVGILIIAIGGFYFYTTTKVQTGIKIEESIIEAQEIPAEFNPIQDFVDRCIYDTAVMGYEEIGWNGGYITPPDPFEFFPNSVQHKVAYWFYAGGSQPRLQMPGLDSRRGFKTIGGELEDYIAEKINVCINDFDEFSRQGFIIEAKEKPAPKVTITDEDTIIEVGYPIKAERGGQKFEIGKFFVRVPFSIKKMYDLAFAIAKNQSDHRYLEKYTRTLITVYSSDKIMPPVNSLKFGFGSDITIKETAKQQFKKILSSYVQALQVLDSKRYELLDTEDQIEKGIHDKLTTLPITSASVENYEVRFGYFPDDLNPRQPFQFEVCKGNKPVCREESITSIIPGFPIKKSEYPYDVQYPVLVTITDPSAFIFGDEGYIFNFFLQSKIVDNVPEHLGIRVPPTIPTGAAVADAYSRESGFFEGLTLCSAEGDGPEVEIKVANATYPNNPIPSAEIYYTVTEISCAIGSTDENGILKYKFPHGTFGGTVTVKSERFLGLTKNYDADSNPGAEIEFRLEPLVEKRFKVYKKLFIKSKYGDYWDFDKYKAEELNEKEQAILSLTRKGDAGEEPFTAFGIFTGKDYSNPPNITLAHGTYDLTINLLLNDRVVIPESKMEVPSLNLFSGFSKKITIPAIDFGEDASALVHAGKLKGLQPGSHKYSVKCLDPKKQEYIEIGPMDISSAQPAPGNLVVSSKTPVSFRTKQGYLAIETNAKTKCEYKLASRTVDGSYIPFPEEGYTHLTSGIPGIPNSYDYSVRCLGADGKWVEQLVALRTNDFNADDKEDFSAAIMSPSSFSGDEAFIAAQTNKPTSCMYGEIIQDQDADERSYKPLGEAKDAIFPEGGVNIENVFFTNPALYQQGDIIFYAIDLGIDDDVNSPKDIDHLNQLEKLDEYSRFYRSYFTPDIK